MINSRRRSVTLEWAGTWNTLDQAVRTLGRPRGRVEHCSQAVRLRKSTPAMQCSRRIKNKLPSAMRSTAAELPSEKCGENGRCGRAETSQGSSAAARALLCAPSLHEELTSLCGGGSFMTSSDGSHFRSNGNIPVFCSKSWPRCTHTVQRALASYRHWCRASARAL